jgi:hypothetical protein
VKLPVETVAAATELAQELSASGTPSHEAFLQVLELVSDQELARCIVAHAETQRPRARRFNHERAYGLYCSGMCGVLIVLLAVAARWLSTWVQAAPSEDLPAAAAACGQAILLRLGWHLVKFGAICITDSLNAASYPTVLHRATVATKDEDAVRLERIRLLIAEMVVRMARGSRFGKLFSELTRIELTRPAAFWLLVQARIGLFIKLNFPPYTNRTRAYLVAGAAAIGCAVGMHLAQHRLATIAQRDYVTTWAFLFVLEFLRSPRRAEAVVGR